MAPASPPPLSALKVEWPDRMRQAVLAATSPPALVRRDILVEMGEPITAIPTAVLAAAVLRAPMVAVRRAAVRQPVSLAAVVVVAMAV